MDYAYGLPFTHEYLMATKKSSATLEALHAQIADLQSQAEAIRKEEIAEVIAKMKVAIEHYGITAADLGLKGSRAARGSAAPFAAKARKSGASPKAARAFKYADDQGNKWVGMGKRPHWFTAALAAGKTPEDLLAK
jgi:DNA-binding protein H-NS